MEESLKIYVCGHDSNLNLVPQRDFIERVDLNALGDNEFAESRIFISGNFSDSEYIGFATANWKKKYPSLPGLHRLDKLSLSPEIVWYAARIELLGFKWHELFDMWLPGVGLYIQRMADYSGLSLDGQNPPLANNFICHRIIFRTFLERWKSIFDYTFKDFSPEDIRGGDRSRTAGYVCEAISMLVLSNLPGVEFRQIELPKTKTFLPLRLF